VTLFNPDLAHDIGRQNTACSSVRLMNLVSRSLPLMRTR